MNVVKTVSREEVLQSWRMMHNFVLIEDYGTPEYEVGRIISPITMRACKNPAVRYGKVLMVGPGKRKWSKILKRDVLIPMEVEPGQIILYWKFHGTHTHYETEDGFVLRVLCLSPDDATRDQVMAVVGEPPEGMTMEQYEENLRKHSYFKMEA